MFEKLSQSGLLRSEIQKSELERTAPLIQSRGLTVRMEEEEHEEQLDEQTGSFLADLDDSVSVSFDQKYFPASFPNSHRHLEPILDASYQDDFDDIHSDYQWFTESGFETDGVAGDPGVSPNYPNPLCLGLVGAEEDQRRLCHQQPGLDFDATMAQIDMEDFQSQDILLRLPPLCASDLQPNQGETIASITGSILQQLDFEDSMTHNSHSVDEDQNNQSMDMSICKSENLFSPINENQQQLPLSTFSTDSLDTRAGELLATCLTQNRNNYTIAFQGIDGLMEESSTTTSTYRTAPETDMTAMITSPVDLNEMTNWRQLKSNKKYRKPNDNNNGSNSDSSDNTNVTTPLTSSLYSFRKSLLTQSCPGSPLLMRNNMRNIKLFDMQNVVTVNVAQIYPRRNNSILDDQLTSGSSGSSGRHNNNFMEESWNNNRHPVQRRGRTAPTTTTQIAEAIKKSRSIQIQTSYILNSNINRSKACDESKSTPISTPGVPPPVYICFPSYTLPDLRFLEQQRSKNDVILMPQKYKVPTRAKRDCGPNPQVPRRGRPMSCNDIEELRSRDLSHVKDWPSLNFLLPTEVQSILHEIKPIDKRERGDESEKDKEDVVDNQNGNSESPVILRKRMSNNSRANPTKRYSLNESSAATNRNRNTMAEKFKRFSLQETLPEVAEITTEIARNLEQLESYSNMTGEEVPSAESSGESLGSRRVPTNTPKQTSFVDFDNHFKTHHQYDDGGAAAAARIIAHVAPMCTATSSSSKHHRNPINMIEKQNLTDGVAGSVSQIQSVLDNKTSTSGAGANPNPIVMSQSPGGKMVLESLCPALYSLLSDGLCPFLETIFGRVPNTVWRVVEASIQYGPTAQTLNELVLRINSEESLAEGPMKFNAFVCGLLNLRNLGSWLTFLRTKERLLRTHYEPEAFMFLCNTSTRFLYDQMLVNMHLLSKPPFQFQLDIFHETKLLHQSMNPSTPTKASASLPISRKNSTKGASTRIASASSTRKSSSADSRTAKVQSKNSKYYANQLKKSQMKRSFSDERPKTPRVAQTALPKSKTAQNIVNTERLQLKPGILSRFPSRPKIPSSTSADEGREKGMEPTKAQRPRSFEGSPCSSAGESSKEPDRFRKLQMQWELLSSDEARKVPKSHSPSPSPSPSTTNTTSNNSNPPCPNLVGSKIPRPITSPTRNNYPGHSAGTGTSRPNTGFKR